VSDRLYLSCWLRGFDEASMLRHFQRVLNVFPFSKLARRGPVLRIYAVEQTEPPLFEQEFPPASKAGTLVEAAAELTHEDCCAEIDTFWDLWQYDGDWKLAPASVRLLCQGPGFESDAGDHLRIEFGTDARFLPMEDVEKSVRMSRSNLRSLLRLVSDIERAVPVERRHIWSESGANFAELLAETVARLGVN
jgi:hypothetical protein